MADDLTRGTELIEQLLDDPELRRSFRADPSSVLRGHGLDALAEGLPPGERAMLTLEMRESRSSLAGVIVAAAAEGVDFTHVAEHAAPRLGGDAGHAIAQFFKKLTSSHHAKPAPIRHEGDRLPRPRVPQLDPAPAEQMAKPTPHAAPAPAPASAPTPAGPAAAEPASAPAPHHEHHEHHHPELAAGLTAHDPYSYPGNDATPQQIAAWMGANARRVGLPPELPVMASLTESGLRNLDYGDRDSVGFFQMRTSIWDEGPYAGYLADPQKQIEWFLSEALAVRGSDPSLASDPNRWGEWVADVERPAAEYRYRYQLQLGEAVQLLRGDASLPGAAAVTGAAAVPGATQAVHHVDLGVAVRHSAMSHHARHHDGHAAGMLDASSDAGLSVSAGAELVRGAYAAHGVQLPVTATEQFEVGAVVPRPDLAPGDAVFFGGAHDSIQALGIYLGDGHVAVGGGREVSLNAPGLHYLGARRYSERLLTGRGSYARTLPTISRHHHHHDH